ncbi:MAG: rsmD [Gammaproteobacteria bacterium]|jgi:16S rRNA (guanine966-N2)-methyltransferase|nr:rsmD [Gammaproteobacteria bacterium]
MDNHVRIIAGLWRGKHITVSDSTLVRPTGDRIRETLFNWLGKTIHKAHCLDLFCGSGILGLEALSRGATEVTFVDSNAQVIAQLKKTLQQLPAAQRPRVLVGVAPNGCPNRAGTETHPYDTPQPTSAYVLHQDGLIPIKSDAYDIIFLDPPFSGDLLTQCMPLLKQYGYEKVGTLIYIEIAATEILTLPQHWQIIKQGKAGHVRYHLIEVTQG